MPTPYPGCEFFLDFKKNNYNSEGLMFNWSDPSITSTLIVKPNPAVDQLNIEWSKYKVITIFILCFINPVLVALVYVTLLVVTWSFRPSYNF